MLLSKATYNTTFVTRKKPQNITVDKVKKKRKCTLILYMFYLAKGVITLSLMFDPLLLLQRSHHRKMSHLHCKIFASLVSHHASQEGFLTPLQLRSVSGDAT